MSSSQIVIQSSPNFDDRPAGAVVDAIVIHYTGMQTTEAALDRLSDTSPEARERGRVSAHYLIDEAGLIYALVDEAGRAWHAGVSQWRGRHGLNDTSIGIELSNPGHDFGYTAFPRVQMDALIDLCKGICKRHPIQPDHVLGHSDIAPGRKIDPGEKFNWRLLARAGIGYWPEPEADDFPRAQMYLSSPTALRAALVKFGYDPDLPTAVLCQAFNRHFAGSDSDTLTWQNAASLSWLNRQILKSAA
ncbi:MAG: N-acetylmuramoyl-L-alanine amidase [Rhodospirillales bacterium]|nr:N-acetylmuramoyl-L-alanine amidase [Alphaproteobacteria bacterium]MCB9986974.1 N-acetylmuramoyl-L-alanine amidase [Rhodospirillales bacterium]USO08252.1 MAG: N-acetylmuramoyl-L-alanine amidase [Rhodospirillales bacterium]